MKFGMAISSTYQQGRDQ